MNRPLVTLLLALATTNFLHAGERSVSDSFSVPPQSSASATSTANAIVPADATTTVLIEQPDPFAPRDFGPSQIEKHQRAENAKIVNRISINLSMTDDIIVPTVDGIKVEQGPHDPYDEKLTALIKSNRLLTSGMKGADDIIVGFVEYTDGEVTRNVSLVMPISGTQAAAAVDDTIISVDRLEVAERGQRDDIDVSNIHVRVLQPVNLSENAFTGPATIMINGQAVDIPAPENPGTPPESLSEINSSMVLQREQAYAFGSKSLHRSMDKGGNETSRTLRCQIWWILW